MARPLMPVAELTTSLPSGATRPVLSIVKPFVLRVKGRDGNVDDTHPAHGTMTTAWFDEDARHGPDRHQLAVQFHVTFAVEDKIDFS